MMSVPGTGAARRSFSASNSAKEAERPCIFQLPATSGLIVVTIASVPVRLRPQPAR